MRDHSSVNPSDNQHKKPKGLSAFTVCKDPLKLDYCIVECINSCLPVCDEFVVGEMGSTDGAREMLEDWARREPKLRIVGIRDWTQERATPTWFTSSLNETREQLRFNHMVQLDGDEILDDAPETYAAIKHAVEHTNAFAFDRVNLIKDGRHIIPEGECVGRWVIRIGPSHLWLPSDEPYPRGTHHILDMAFLNPGIRIFHMGFLRKPAAFYAKARVVLGAFFGNYDQRLIDAENEGVSPMSKMPWFDRLVPYNGPYPASVRKWMEERGYHVP